MSHQSLPHKSGTVNPSDFHATARNAEQRCEKRFTCVKRIGIIPTNGSQGQPFQEVDLVDCSVHGLGLMTDKPMEAASQFIANLMPERSLLVLYTVRHCRPDGHGRFQVGASFEAFFGTPTMQDPQELLNVLLEESQAEQGG